MKNLNQWHSTWVFSMWSIPFLILPLETKFENTKTKVSITLRGKSWPITPTHTIWIMMFCPLAAHNCARFDAKFLVVGFWGVFFFFKTVINFWQCCHSCCRLLRGRWSMRSQTWSSPPAPGNSWATKSWILVLHKCDTPAWDPWWGRGETIPVWDFRLLGAALHLPNFGEGCACSPGSMEVGSSVSRPASSPAVLCSQAAFHPGWVTLHGSFNKLSRGRDPRKISSFYSSASSLPAYTPRPQHGWQGNSTLQDQRSPKKHPKLVPIS